MSTVAQETGVPALSPRQRAVVRRSRETLVDGGLLEVPPGASGVPKVIEASWRRCVGEHVPVAPSRIDFREPRSEPSSLVRAAAPVLERLRWSLADVAVAMVLSDATGRIVARHADVRRQRLLMDRAHAAEGFDFSEQSVGTNGLGTVLVERRPVLVRGPEHYNADLESLTCAGTPVVEPYTGRLLGSFSLACATRDVHPLMTAMASDVGRQIEARLLDEAGDRRRRFVQASLALDRAKTGALVVDEESVLANRLGLAHAGPELHPVLWQFLTEHAPRGPQRMAIPLSDGLYDAVVEPAHDGDKAAYSVRLLDRQPMPCSDDEERADAGALAHREPLHFDDQVDRELDTVARQCELVALTGASGTGKLQAALRVLARQGATDPVVVEPHLDPDWFGRASTAAESGRGLVLRRVHIAPVPSAAQVQALATSGVAVALTADLDGAADAVVGLVRQVATTVRLPELALHRSHLPSLVRTIVAEIAEPAPRFSPAVWDVLTSWHWPGNLAELHNTVALLARRAGGGAVEIGDLPAELRAPRGPMSLLESAERKAVSDALQAAGGNRSHAAQALGIGRNTLYRKMREFGLE